MLVMSSCYYEEGPIYSLRTRKQRLAQSWKYTQATINNLDITSSFDGQVLTFTKDNDVSWHTLTTDTAGQDSIYMSSGRWEFDAPNFAKLDLFFIDSTTRNTFGESWEILKLTKKELRLYAKTEHAVVEYYLSSED
jgi:hypothetical protein